MVRKGIKRFSIAVTAIVVTVALATPLAMAQGVNFSDWWSRDVMGINRVTTVISTGTIQKKDSQFWLQSNHGTFLLVGGKDSLLNQLAGKHVTVWGTQSSDNVITVSKIVPLNDKDNSALSEDIRITTVKENNADTGKSSIEKSVQVTQSSNENTRSNNQSVVTSNSIVTIENNSTSQREVHINLRSDSNENDNGRNVNNSNIIVNNRSTTVTENR